MNRLLSPSLALLVAALAAPLASGASGASGASVARAAEAHVKLRTVEVVAGENEETDPGIEPHVAAALRKLYGPQFKGKLSLVLRGSQEATGPEGTRVERRSGRFILSATVRAVDGENGRVTLDFVLEEETKEGGRRRVTSFQYALGRDTVLPVEVPGARRADRTTTWAVTARPQ